MYHTSDRLRAYFLMCDAHEGQTDLADKPYRKHPERVSRMLRPDLEAEIVGLLHDVLEDTDVTYDDLVEEFDQNIADAVQRLTRDGSYETYMEYIYDVRGHGVAHRVKIADLQDNMKLWRIPQKPTDQDWNRWKKYHRAWRMLKKAEEAYEEDT